jgi:HD-like signal output (HDOD) protein
MKFREQLAAKLGELPSLPHVAVRVLELVDLASTTAGQLEQAISRDPALAVGVLRLANSAYFGLRGRVTSLERAVVILGFNTVRLLTMAACTKSLFTSPRSSFKDKVLWEHALATGVIARGLAEHCRYSDGAEAFVAGLIHDIGKTVMDQNLGRPYLGVIERVYNEGQSFTEAEQDLLGFTHPEAGALVAQAWDLAVPLGEAVRCHHAPEQAQTAPQLCAIVALANAVAMKLEVGPERRPDLDLGSLPAASMLSMTDDTLAEFLVDSTQRLNAQRNLFRMD